MKNQKRKISPFDESFNENWFCMTIERSSKGTSIEYKYNHAEYKEYAHKKL
jgi:hypothetical protein